MSKRYPGGVIRKTPATPTQSSASGVWGMTDVTQAQQTNNWPVANVPNPMSRSLRFRASASAYLSRTAGTPTDAKKWTWSGWVKRGALGSYPALIDGYSTPNSWSSLTFFDNVISFYNIIGGVDSGCETPAVFRDPSAWYHVVFVFDSTNATATDRTIIYVNGVKQTTTNPYGTVGLNEVAYWNSSGYAQAMGRRTDTGFYYDGYMAEVNFVDGQALTPTAFGQYDQFSNWTSKKYTGTYGANGFYLPFSNNSSTGTLGLDFSGNNNTWTTNNFSVTAGSTYDSMVDVPTQWTPYNVTGDTGGVIRGNYAVMNPLGGPSGGLQGTLTNGNLTYTSATSDQKAGIATMALNTNSTGKWYWEVTATSKTSTYWAIGVFPYNINQYSATSGYSQYRSDGAIYVNGSLVTTVTSYTTGDVIGMAFDASNNELKYYKNGTLITTQTVANSAGYGIYPGAGSDNSGSSNVNNFNFGQMPFVYAPPSGYKSLCTTNLPTPTIQQGNLVMDATLWTGNGSARSITNAAPFKPDFVWIKSRTDAGFNHDLFDSVRGVGNTLFTDTTGAEEYSAQRVTAFNSNGFSLGTAAGVNYSGSSFVGWQWQAGQGTTSSNTSGSITSTTSVNATAGFSVVTYTGNGTSGATVGHGLGVAPSMVIVKSRSGNTNWPVWHTSTAGYNMFLNATDEQSATNYRWSGTPNSTTFGISSLGDVNTSGGTYVAYCWAAVAGYSAFGGYTGNGSTDGPFIYTGFRPKYVMIKRTDYLGDWTVVDTSRNQYNYEGLVLAPNTSAAETSNTYYTGGVLDGLSNGFKIRNGSGPTNPAGGTCIYMAFAEYPFKSALAR